MLLRFSSQAMYNKSQAENDAEVEDMLEVADSLNLIGAHARETIMDLNRMPNDQKLELCRWYFKVGCALLPFVWAVNAVWFAREAFLKPAFDEQKHIKRYVMLSGLGAVLWSIALAGWVTVYQTQRVHWGATGDALSFIVPLGRA